MSVSLAIVWLCEGADKIANNIDIHLVHRKIKDKQGGDLRSGTGHLAKEAGALRLRRCLLLHRRVCGGRSGALLLRWRGGPGGCSDGARGRGARGASATTGTRHFLL